ncbi:MAG: hypothetical protein P8N76_03830 [Pirellulaceae bacterium]|nr:hypothetical protein [Pirellulaceae bacterium]
MNYFAHGRAFTNHPYFLAGTAIPDWLNVVDRRVRARSKLARPFLNSKDQRIAAIAAGILKHHQDDDWFHRTRAFAELSWSFTVEIRDRLPPDDGLRPSFLGHILVELLLDDALIQADPAGLEAYYDAIDSLDPTMVAWTVERMTGKPVPKLALLMPRFSEVRFLYDYAQDAKLLFRLNNVMQRVKLAALPVELTEWFPIARRSVNQRVSELLNVDTHSPSLALKE